MLSAQRFGDTLKRMGSYLLVGAVVRGVKSFIEEQIESADALKHNAERLGVTTDELQKYEYVSNLMGVSVAQTSTSLRYFNRTVGEAALGTKAAVKTFALLGVSVKDAQGNVRPTDELLFEFADKLQKIPSQAERTAFAMRTLGKGGAAMLPVLQKGSEELRTLFADIEDLGGGFNNGFIEIAHQTDVQLKRLRRAYRSVYVAIATEVLPIVTRWVTHSIKNVKVLIDYAKHTYGVRTALMALASGAVFVAVTRLMKLFAVGKRNIRDWLFALAQNAALVAFVALLTAAYLILDDLYTFMQGGDSVLGRFLDQIGGSGTALKFWYNLKDIFDQIATALTPVVDSLKPIVKDLGQAFIDNLPSIIKWGGVFTAFVLDKIDRAVTLAREFGLILSGAKSSEQIKLVDEMRERLEMYRKMALAFDGITSGGVANPRGADFVGPLATPTQLANAGLNFRGEPVAGVPATPPAVHVEVNNTFHGAGDPKGTAAAVGKSVKQGVKDGMAAHRDTYDAVNQGMPITGY